MLNSIAFALMPMIGSFFLMFSLVRGKVFMLEPDKIGSRKSYILSALIVVTTLVGAVVLVGNVFAGFVCKRLQNCDFRVEVALYFLTIALWIMFVVAGTWVAIIRNKSL